MRSYLTDSSVHVHIHCTSCMYICILQRVFIIVPNSNVPTVIFRLEGRGGPGWERKVWGLGEEGVGVGRGSCGVVLLLMWINEHLFFIACVSRVWDP